jgi:putative sterol carrier protein
MDMTHERASTQPSRNFRQTLEGMPLFFNPAAAEGMKADIQFNAGGREPGVYHLRIDSGRCAFHTGPSPRPDLVVNTPSEVWLRIGAGEISGQDALLQGLYTISGDAMLLLQFNALFVEPADFSIRDASEPIGQLFEIFRNSRGSLTPDVPAGKRPAGPLPVSGMAWMNLLFIPWTLFWALFDIRSIDPRIGAGVPLALMSLLVGYRVVFNRPLWMETASLLFFAAAFFAASILRVPVFIAWGSILGALFMAAIWLISLSPLVSMPFCAEYSKWGFIRGLWVMSQFLEPNMAISLVWGWTFILGAGFGIAARTLPEYATLFTVIRYSLMFPAFIFTSLYQKGAQERQFADIDRRMSRQRGWAYVGLAVAAVMSLALICMPVG